jgi:hypothetical protein
MYLDFTLPAQAAWMGPLLKQEKATWSMFLDQVYVSLVSRTLTMSSKRTDYNARKYLQFYILSFLCFNTFTTNNTIITNISLFDSTTLACVPCVLCLDVQPEEVRWQSTAFSIPTQDGRRVQKAALCNFHIERIAAEADVSHLALWML